MKLKITYCLVLVLAMISGKPAHAQQLPLFSQYLFNGFLINPAYAGLNGYSTVNLTAREQWVGLADAPTTHIVSFQTRILQQSFIHKSASARRKMMRKNANGRVGIGGYVYNDKVGIINRTGLQAAYAYHIPMDKGTNLSFALAGSLYQFSIPRDQISTEMSRDPLIDNISLNMWIPDVSVGCVYSTPTYYAGISANQLLQAYLKFGGSVDNTYRLYRQYNITGGYRYEINDDYAVEPSILIKVTNQMVAQADITTRVYYNDYWAGVSYRTGGAAIFMMGVSVNKFLFGYAFDYNFNSLQTKTYGSHEFMVAYKFGDNPARLRFLNR
jgi:type IX secretion system PorP/SprF family membrane protein